MILSIGATDLSFRLACSSPQVGSSCLSEISVYSPVAGALPRRTPTGRTGADLLEFRHRTRGTAHNLWNRCLGRPDEWDSSATGR